MINLIMLLILSPYTALLVGVFAAYKVYKEKDYYMFRSPHTWNSWNIGLLCLFIWSFVVGLVNGSILSMGASVIFVLYFSLSILIQQNCNTIDMIDRISYYLMKFSVVAGVFGLFEKFILENFSASLWRMYLGLPLAIPKTHRIASTFVNSNVAGDWFAIMIIIGVFYLGKVRTTKERIYYGSCTTFFLIILCLTGSRGAFFALIAGMSIMLTLRVNRRNLIAIGTIFAIVAVVGFMPSEVSAISNEITGHEIERSFDTREEIWRGSLKMSQLKPLTGWGLIGTIEQTNRFFDVNGVVNHSHNIWLSITTSLGIVGFMIYLFMRLRVYRGFVYLYRENSAILPLLAGIQVALLAHGIIDFTIIAPQIGILFVGSSSLVVALAKEEVRAIARGSSIPV